eukprot:TRINITY_DN105405_c0_g1_i1.p1 TRINITY_DN105405_c0_g1~~TRINITY_DN105405_c0_g1_i1.p1  ORF type:complete len:583 (+),score=86.27 TRINITY_DN105405_c0_g1_i1:157-1905(+)
MGFSETVAPFGPYFAEFLGTYFIVFTAALLLISDAEYSGNKMWRSTGIGFMTMAATYSMGSASGGHLNPAVSLAFGFTRKVYWRRVWCFMIIQILGGMAASETVRIMMQKALPAVEPKPFYNTVDAAVVEGIYSFLICFVALNCMASLQNNPKGNRNQFFGLAIGLTLIAGGGPASEVSGGFLNPAITLGFLAISPPDHLLRSSILVGAQFVGAFVSAILFFMTRPEELVAIGVTAGEGLGCSRICSAIQALNLCGKRQREEGDEEEEGAHTSSDEEVDVTTQSRKYVAPWPARMMSEFIGTYMVVLTFGLCAVASNRQMQEDQKINLSQLLAGSESEGRLHSDRDVTILSDQVSTPYCAGAALCALTYALGTVSGAEFNPAVTLAAMLSSRDPFVWAEAPTRLIAQSIAAVSASITTMFVCRGQNQVVGQSLPYLGPAKDASWTMVSAGEMFFTATLAYVVLCTTKIDSPRYQKANSTSSFDFALAIGFMFMAGGWLIQPISGGMMNPAASLGIATSDVLNAWLKHLGDLSALKSELKSVTEGLVKYVAFEFAGGAVAAFVFWLVHPLLYKPDPLLAFVKG